MILLFDDYIDFVNCLSKDSLAAKQNKDNDTENRNILNYEFPGDDHEPAEPSQLEIDPKLPKETSGCARKLNEEDNIHNSIGDEHPSNVRIIENSRGSNWENEGVSADYEMVNFYVNPDAILDLSNNSQEQRIAMPKNNKQATRSLGSEVHLKLTSSNSNSQVEH